MNIDQPEYWMRLALEEAKLALAEDEVPVGAVVVRDGALLGRGHNRNRALADPTAHAEMLALTAACQAAQEARLDGADIYVTLEPCPMCAGAIVLARIAQLYYGTSDPHAGACGTLMDIVREPRLNHIVEVYRGLEADECGKLLSEFFSRLRDDSGRAGQ